MKRDICEKRVSEYLNSAMPVVSSRTSVMVKNSSDVLPVVDQGRFEGLISWVELLDAALGDCSPHSGCERNG